MFQWKHNTPSPHVNTKSLQQPIPSLYNDAPCLLAVADEGLVISLESVPPATE
jgi:hypothetical protein